MEHQIDVDDLNQHELYVAIPNRCSWRKYTEIGITEAEVSPLIEYAIELSQISPWIKFRIIYLPEETCESMIRSFPLFNLKNKGRVSYLALMTIDSSAPRPYSDLIGGFLAELFVLRATSLDIHHFYIGGVNVYFKMDILSQLVSDLGSDEVIALGMPLGHAVEPEVVLGKRKEIADTVQGEVTGHPQLTEESLRRVFTAYQRAPSAHNRQPWMLTVTQLPSDADSSLPLRLSLSLSRKQKKIREGKFLTKWLDLGIAASHVYLQLRQEFPECPLNWGFTETGVEFNININI
eukprot:gnl/Dysnectes_brevis/7703_a13190_241.p1 GENE.gnl/Dysnectes_brevis/7703_a13190_241~~gnl/Dysnectes_brevis/7703_a13190_241.p1  ORF type:complete len:301 (+),score=32.88 gnl/Dysnectes_brevis/7703_a13190_241:30-905(+)